MARVRMVDGRAALRQQRAGGSELDALIEVAQIVVIVDIAEICLDLGTDVWVEAKDVVAPRVLRARGFKVVFDIGERSGTNGIGQGEVTQRRRSEPGLPE